MIEREADKHTPENPGHIIAKMNALTDPSLIKALYAASQMGVQIDLIVRGMCCLRPGVPDLSENIRVMSIVGRFLEHSRIFYFRNGGDDEIYIGSADWMARNLDRRVEVVVPVISADLRRTLRDDVLYVVAERQSAGVGSKRRRPLRTSRTRAGPAPIQYPADAFRNACEVNCIRLSPRFRISNSLFILTLLRFVGAGLR